MSSEVSACALCHFDALAARPESRCATCHPQPRHVRTTSQGVLIAHAQLDDARVPCTRCHYQLVEGTTRVDTSRCSACHAGETANAPMMSADTLHSGHEGYRCEACHEPVIHRVVAMSTSVELRCTDCHASRHRRPIPSDTVPGSRCGECHEGVHADEQRLILGLLPGEPIRPSPMFMGGVTCASCHVVPGAPPPRPGASLVATQASCTGCHGPEWAGILDRWRRGFERRDRRVAGYVRAAAAAVADTSLPADARSRVAEARRLLSFVRDAGPLHNLPTTDRLMRRALQLAEGAYQTAGISPPDAPPLGPPVRSGSCISCHYGVEEAATGLETGGSRAGTHADHLFGGGLSCDACHAVGAPPPGIPETVWIDTARGDGIRRGAPPRR
jgi:hypothetical protein